VADPADFAAAGPPAPHRRALSHALRHPDHPATPGINPVPGSYYDQDGHRVGVVTRNAAGTITKTRLFIGDSEVELTAANTIGTAYSYLSVVSPTGGWTASNTTWANNVASVELQYHGLSSNTLVSVNAGGVVQSAFVYAPYGDVVQASGATTATIAGQRRRFNDKFRDDLTGLSYYGVRYYDGLALGWTQADPMYRFAPDVAWTEPRKAGLYVFDLENPLRYIDPNGRDLIFEGSARQFVPVVKAYQKLVGNDATVKVVPVRGTKNVYRIKFDATVAKPNRNAAALVRMADDRSKTVIVRNSDPKDAVTAADKARALQDEADGKPSANGGGSFSPTAAGATMKANGRALTVVGIVTVNFSNKKDEVTSSLDHSKTVEQTNETILGHETLGHGDKGCRDEKCARDEENRVRKVLDLPTRESDPKYE